MFQVWSPTDNQAVDWGEYLPKVFGVGAQAADLLRTQLGFQVWVSRPLIGVRTYPGALGLCTQAAWPLIWVLTYLGFRCVLGLLIQRSKSRG